MHLRGRSRLQRELALPAFSLQDQPFWARQKVFDTRSNLKRCVAVLLAARFCVVEKTRKVQLLDDVRTREARFRVMHVHDIPVRVNGHGTSHTSAITTHIADTPLATIMNSRRASDELAV